MHRHPSFLYITQRMQSDIQALMKMEIVSIYVYSTIYPVHTYMGRAISQHICSSLHHHHRWPHSLQVSAFPAIGTKQNTISKNCIQALCDMTTYIHACRIRLAPTIKHTNKNITKHTEPRQKLAIQHICDTESDMHVRGC